MTLPRLSLWNDYSWAVLVGVVIGVACLFSPVIAFGLIAGIVFLVIALRAPIVLCYVVIAATVFLSGMPRGHLINLFIPNEPILVMSAGLAFFAITVRRDKVRYPPMFLLALLTFIGGTAVAPLLAYFARGFSLNMSDIFSLLAPVQYLVLVWMFSQIPRDDAERHGILQWMLLCASGVAFIGLLQAVNFSPAVSLLSQWYPSSHQTEAADLGRVTSVLGAWNSLGNYLMIALLLIIAMQGYKRTLLANLNMLVALTLTGACLLASGSYASLIGLVLGVMVIKGVFDRHGMKILLLLVIGFLVAAVVLQAQISERLGYQFRNGGLIPETLAYRFIVWQQIYLPIIGKHLIWGVSPTFAGYVTWGWAESQYLYLLFRSGLMSLMAHITFVTLLMVWAYRHVRSDASLGRMLAIVLFTILLVLSIMGLTNEVFTSSGAIDYLWIIIGLVAGAGRVITNTRTSFSGVE